MTATHQRSRRGWPSALLAGLAAAALAIWLPVAAVAHSTATSSASRCTKVGVWDGAGQGGDKKDFSVTLKITGPEPGPYSARVKVVVHNPKVLICSATVSWYEGNGATGQHSASVHIGPHGGLSSPVTLPVGADGGLAKVRARLR